MDRSCCERVRRMSSYSWFLSACISTCLRQRQTVDSEEHSSCEPALRQYPGLGLQQYQTCKGARDRPDHPLPKMSSPLSV